jgi:hypothetical protein
LYSDDDREIRPLDNTHCEEFSMSDWNRSVEALLADLQGIKALVTNPETDLLTPIPHGQGQTI